MTISPRRTIATAQNLYHRFHLFFLRKDFNDNVGTDCLAVTRDLRGTHLLPQDISLAALYVSSKMHDTLKKPKEILMVAYVVRFPELAAKSRSIMGEIEMDAAVSSFGFKIPWNHTDVDYVRRSSMTNNDY